MMPLLLLHCSKLHDIYALFDIPPAGLVSFARELEKGSRAATPTDLRSAGSGLFLSSYYAYAMQQVSKSASKSVYNARTRSVSTRAQMVWARFVGTICVRAHVHSPRP